jgi:hypothetical protein
MAFVNGKNAKFTINSVDLSAFMTSVKVDRKADSHDVTTFGSNSHKYAAGLKDASITLEGVYDDGTTGPGATLRAMVGGAAQAFEYDPEGDTTGNPTVTGNVLVLDYAESVPVADMISWTADLQVTGDLTDGTVA